MKLNQLKIQANEKGFTLIELMIVIAIIGILAAVAIPNFIAYRDKAFCSAAESDANSIKATLADYFAIPAHTTLVIPVGEGLQLGDDADVGFKEAGCPTNSSYGTDDCGLKFSPLSNTNIGTIEGGVSAIRISVLDGSGRCPDDYMEAQEDAGWDKDTRTFSKAME